MSEEMKLQDLKAKNPVELLEFAETVEVENASTLRKQELMFAILKKLAEKDITIVGEGVVEVLSDGFAFLRSPEANYLSGPDDFMSARARFAAFHCAQVIRLLARFGRQKKANGISRCSKSAPSILKSQKKPNTKFILTI